MTENSILFNTNSAGVATITLNRPERHNAFDDTIIATLIKIIDNIELDKKIRVVVLRAEGKSFSAGADLHWMRRMADYTTAENKADATELAALMSKLRNISKPTIARVQGAAFGGGVGLVACCDIAVATEKAVFSLSEARLGLIPAVISPYVIAAMGERAASRYFLTAERFNADEALRLQLVNQVVPTENLDETINALIGHLLQNGPEALAQCKALIAAVSNKTITHEVVEDTTDRITIQRATAEGKEGVSAFLEKRKPSWIKE